MKYPDLIGSVDFTMDRRSAFSYVCRSCRRCCHHKSIRVGPYETLRLSRRLGVTTTEFLARHTEAGGTVLRNAADGACGFLGEMGCSVHADRPLACRIYPLARWVAPTGEESFGHLQPHPRTEGAYGEGGTVEAYVTDQGLEPYFAMVDRYATLYNRMLELLRRLDSGEASRRFERRDDVDELPPGELASAFLDVDASVARYCRDRALAAPEAVDERIGVHLRAIAVWLDRLEARVRPAPP